MRWGLLLLVAFPSLVIGAVGTITNQDGNSTITRQNTSLSGTKGSEIEMLDVVSTGKGKTGITFIDDTHVNITENSKLVIDDFVYDSSTKSAGKLVMKVALGTVRYASGQVAHDNPNNVKISTPTATIAVRGTDFVMSVDEIGRSVVVLMPQCDDSDNPVCNSGVIDVITPAGSITMNKPYQATLVESKGDSPPIPTIIKFDSRQVGNNMMISSPKTEGGISLVHKARDAVKEASKSKQEKSATLNNTPTTGVVGISSDQEAQIAQDATTSINIKQPTNDNSKPVQKSLEELLTESSHVVPIYRQQILTNWKYYNMSSTQFETASIVLPKDTTVQVVVIQDLIQDTFQFANKPGGFITIRQNQK